MSEEKVRLSNVDRGIGIFTAVNSYKSRKINEQILVQQFNGNKHLTDLKRQIKEANAINKQILANQLKAEEHKESQKYFKALSYNLFETVDVMSKIDDLMVLNYALTNYYEKIKLNIIEANDRLEEIGDKTFNKQTLDKLNSIKDLADKKHTDYSTNILNKIDNYLSDFKKEEARISAIKMPKFKTEIIKRNRINTLRTISIGIIGFFAFFIIVESFGVLFYKWNSGSINVYLIMSVGLVYAFIKILRKEIKWRKVYDEFIKNEKQRKEDFEKSKIEMNAQYELNIQNEKEKLFNHPFYKAMIKINNNHPTFDKSLSEIIEIVNSFEKKWGL